MKILQGNTGKSERPSHDNKEVLFPIQSGHGWLVRSVHLFPLAYVVSQGCILPVGIPSCQTYYVAHYCARD